METESISLDEAKASSRKVREAGKTISNRSILNEIRDRDLFTPPDKKTRKQRQKEEQAELPLPKNINQTQTFDEIERGSAPTASRQAQVSFEEEEAITSTTREIPKVEVLDYEDLLDDYGF